jgi:endonuclease/exonuclease/phosphatase (EEP) superfamily protein YafD
LRPSAEPLLPTVESGGQRHQRSLLRSVLLALYTALTGAYGLSVAGFLLLHFTVGERWALVALFNTFLHLLLLPSVALLPVSLLFRRWVAALLVAPAFAAFTLAYGGQFLPKGGASEAESFTLLTYNVLADNTAYAQMLAVVQSADPDVVALQELRSEAAYYLASNLRAIYPHQALHPDATGYAGQAVFSRYPISNDDYWQLYQSGQRVTIELPSKAVTLYSTHMAIPWVRNFDTSNRTEEVNDLLLRAENDAGPVLIAGDFNMTDWAADYGRVTARYADSYREVGWGMGFTFPAFSPTNPQLAFLPPLARIDYVFHDHAFQALESTVLPDTGGSDHHPLLVRLRLLSNG